MFFPGSPLNYPTNSLGSIRRFEEKRAPNKFDSKNFTIGDEWLDTSSDDWYKLVSLANGEALWCSLCGTGQSSEKFIPDSGTTPVVPNASNEVILAGGDGITTVGGLNTVTFDLTINPVEEVLPDSGTTPIVPNASGQLTITGTNNITTIGGLNTLTIDYTLVPFAEMLPDSGTTPIVPNASNQVTVTGANGIETIGGLNTLTIGLIGSGFVAEFLPDSGTSPVVPNGSAQVTTTGNNGITVIGGLNTLTYELTGTFDGDWTFTCPGNGATWMWDCIDRCVNFRGIDTGFSNSQWITCQAGVQTLNAIPTVIADITVPLLKALTVRATFTGSRDDHTAALAGDIVYGARRVAGGAIELSPPIVNVMDDGAASVTIDAAIFVNDLRLIVVGEVATTWNWVVTYEYQELRTNA